MKILEKLKTEFKGCFSLLGIIIVICLVCQLGYHLYSDIMYYFNDIQNEFYNVPFGSSRSDVVSKFRKFDLFDATNDSTKNKIKFISKSDSLIFGGVKWNYAYVNISIKD